MTISKSQRMNAVVGGGDGAYMAHCPELDVFGMGASPTEALHSLFVSVRSTAAYIATRKLEADSRRPHAELVVAADQEKDGVLQALFDSNAPRLNAAEFEEVVRYFAYFAMSDDEIREVIGDICRQHSTKEEIQRHVREKIGYADLLTVTEHPDVRAGRVRVWLYAPNGSMLLV